jgi:hypothetical protein
MSLEAGSYLGVKYAVLIAGFSGAMLSLRFMRELTYSTAAVAVATGTLVAHFFTLAVSKGALAAINWGLAKFNVAADLVVADIDGGIAFLLGLCAMNLVAGIVTLSERFKANPGSFKKVE